MSKQHAADSHWSSLMVMPRPATVRSLCLLVLAFGLIMIYAGVYFDQYKRQMCAERTLEDLARLRDDMESRSLRRHLDRDDVDDGGGDDDVIVVVNRTRSSAQSKVSASWDYKWDVPSDERQNVNEIPDRTLILVRHGQYDLSTGHLTALGREQAAMTGQRLKDANISYAEIIHSTLDRAAETANIIHGYLPAVPIRPDEMLVEGGPVPPLPTITYWHLPDKAYHVDGPRLESAFRKYFYRGDRTLKRETHQILVAHGNIFRFFALRALQLSKEAWMRIFIAHASITQLHIRADGTVSLTKLGDSGHFPPNKVTY